MKKILLILIVAATSMAVHAQRGRHHRDFFDHTPIGGSSLETVLECSFKLEKEEYNWRRNRYDYILERTFTAEGRRACDKAEQDCLDAKSDRFPSWEYRCVKGQERRVSRPQKACAYSIKTLRFGMDSVKYEGFGRRACEKALNKCLDALDYRQTLPRWDSDRVGPRATCEKVMRRDPRPRPPRMVSASCTVNVYFQSNNGSRRTAQPSVTRTASARTHQEAMDRACDQAKRDCEANQPNTRFFCQ